MEPPHATGRRERVEERQEEHEDGEEQRREELPPPREEVPLEGKGNLTFVKLFVSYLEYSRQSVAKIQGNLPSSVVCLTDMRMYIATV